MYLALDLIARVLNEAAAASDVQAGLRTCQIAGGVTVHDWRWIGRACSGGRKGNRDEDATTRKAHAKS